MSKKKVIPVITANPRLHKETEKDASVAIGNNRILRNRQNRKKPKAVQVYIGKYENKLEKVCKQTNLSKSSAFKFGLNMFAKSLGILDN